MDYTKYQIKWLQKRLAKMFPEDFLLTVDLDDPADYEEQALKGALQHY